ncbi:DUF2267 domain-containing protein [Actinokineospora enzanensis]|uniref:DUF2267 domain-containing protein n=1 Tax=Actinokineospora enzanensis TaxID=155975 RepID=UPI00036A7241|nr:DUF2267 domain-containing protein [Actinokineospora enzanensis]
MSRQRTHVFDNAAHTARQWLCEVAERFPTADEDFAYRALRSWLHLVRDQLAPESTAHLAAQLPELLRGVFYEGWRPAHVPASLGAAEFAAEYAVLAGISQADVDRTAPVVTAALADRLSPGLIDKILGQLRHDVRALIAAPDPG